MNCIATLKDVEACVYPRCVFSSAQSMGFLPRKVHHWCFAGSNTAWHLALDRGNDICCVFLDLSKAFDKVPHITLLDTLADISINPHVLNWLYTRLFLSEVSVCSGQW